MLTGEEKILDTNNDDICNYLGNALAAIGACGVEVKKNVFTQNELQKLIIVRFNDGSAHAMCIRESRHDAMTINFIKEYIIRKRNEIRG